MEVKVKIGDLTQMEVDAIVHPANSKGSMGGRLAKDEAARTIVKIVRSFQSQNLKEVWFVDRSGELAQEFETALKG